MDFKPTDARRMLLDDWRPPAAPHVAAIAAAFGVAGEGTALAAERHGVFHIRHAESEAVLRFGPAEDRSLIEMQVALLDHVAGRGAPVPRVIRGADGEAVIESDYGLAWMATYLPGTLLWQTPLTAPRLRALGAAAARLDAALHDFDHPGLHRPLAWDLRRSTEARPLTRYIADADLRRRAERALDAATDAVKSGPVQAIHNDLNPYNILVAGETVVGIIDFGDAVTGPRVHDLAVAAAYHVTALAGPFAGAAALIGGFHAASPLSPSERALLPPLIAARLALTATITSWRATHRPKQSAYILRNLPAARDGLAMLDTLTAAKTLAMIATETASPAP